MLWKSCYKIIHLSNPVVKGYGLLANDITVQSARQLQSKADEDDLV